MAKSTTTLAVPAFAGIDYHKKFSMITVGDQSGKVITTQKVPNDKELIRKFFIRYSDLVCAVESCRGYQWFVDFLKEDLKLIVHLANPYQLKLIAQSRCKTDKVDSRIIMELLAIGFLPTCYQPTPQERRLREQLRWRVQLVRYVTRIKARIKDLLDKENIGLVLPDPFSRTGRQMLKEMPISSARRMLLDKHMHALEYFEEQVAAEDKEVAKLVKASREAQLLMTIPGIGALTALFIIAELGDVSRFKNASQVASYVGIVPSVYSSADVKRTGPITKQGQALVRWMLIQCAWHAIRTCPALRLHFSAVSTRAGQNPAVVSVARKLIKIAYRVLRDRKAFRADLVGKQQAA